MDILFGVMVSWSTQFHLTAFVLHRGENGAEFVFLIQIDLFITYTAKSPVPAVYSVFVRNENPRYRFTAEETAHMLSRNCVHLLPPHHWKREKLIAWAVSNRHAPNNREEYASAIAKFIPVRLLYVCQFLTHHCH